MVALDLDSWVLSLSSLHHHVALILLAVEVSGLLVLILCMLKAQATDALELQALLYFDVRLSELGRGVLKGAGVLNIVRNVLKVRD